MMIQLLPKTLITFMHIHGFISNLFRTSIFQLIQPLFSVLLNSFFPPHDIFSTSPYLEIINYAFLFF